MFSEQESVNTTFNEADTIAMLINPALYKKDWTEDLIKREVSAGTIEIINSVPCQRKRGRADIVLRLQPLPQKQPVSVAVIEAKAEKFPPTLGLEQAKKYAQL
jgi:type I restriction enzyme R subunit